VQVEEKRQPRTTIPAEGGKRGEGLTTFLPPFRLTLRTNHNQTTSLPYRTLIRLQQAVHTPPGTGFCCCFLPGVCLGLPYRHRPYLTLPSLPLLPYLKPDRLVLHTLLSFLLDGDYYYSCHLLEGSCLFPRWPSPTLHTPITTYPLCPQTATFRLKQRTLTTEIHLPLGPLLPTRQQPQRHQPIPVIVSQHSKIDNPLSPRPAPTKRIELGYLLWQPWLVTRLAAPLRVSQILQ
jgi:hypothetical protein